jgi:hypothetical protein
MEIPSTQEKSEQIFFAQPKAHQLKFGDTNKKVPMDQLKLIAFFEKCQAVNEVAGILEKITKNKSSQKKRRRLIFLLIKLPGASSPQVLQLSSKQPMQS